MYSGFGTSTRSCHVLLHAGCEFNDGQIVQDGDAPGACLFHSCQTILCYGPWWWLLSLDSQSNIRSWIHCDLIGVWGRSCVFDCFLSSETLLLVQNMNHFTDTHVDWLYHYFPRLQGETTCCCIWLLILLVPLVISSNSFHSHGQILVLLLDQSQSHFLARHSRICDVERCPSEFHPTTLIGPRSEILTAAELAQVQPRR